MAIQNITDSALLAKESRRTIQQYITNGKITMAGDTLGTPQMNTTELIRVSNTSSGVPLKKTAKMSQYVAAKLPKRNNTINLIPDELEDIINHAVESTE